MLQLVDHWDIRASNVNLPFGVRPTSLLTCLGISHVNLEMTITLFGSVFTQTNIPQKLELGYFPLLSYGGKRQPPFWGAQTGNMQILDENLIYSMTCERCFNPLEKFL